MPSGYISLIPEALAPLVDSLSGDNWQIRQNLTTDLATFLSPRLANGYLAPAFTTSSLGYNGSPVEFSLTSAHSNGVAMTYDSVLPHEAILTPDKLPAQYSSFCPPTKTTSPPNFQYTRQLQPDHWDTLKFGTWFGRKYSTKGTATKLYSEAQPNYVLGSDTDLIQRLETCGLTLLMLGYYPEQPQSPVEYYMQWHNAVLTQQDIKAIVTAIDMPPLGSAFLTFMDTVFDAMEAKHSLPETTYGISLTCLTEGGIQNITLFTMAPGFLRQETTSIDSFISLSKQLQLPISQLEELKKRKVPIQLNVLGFSLDKFGYTSLNCTFSPSVKHFEAVNQSIPLSTLKRYTDDTDLAPLLDRYQVPSGAFISDVKVPGGRRYQDENAFITAQVLRTLVDKPRDWPPVQRALDFLQTCEVSPGKYSFWPQTGHPSWMAEERIQPDVDDTAVIAELLFRFGRLSTEALQQVLCTINSYQVTRVDPRRPETQHQWARCQSYYTWMTPAQNISQLDCCVNTNALVLLHQYQQATRSELPAYRQIHNMLYKALTWSQNDYHRLNSLIPYYAHPNEWLSALIYAHSVGVPDLRNLIKSLSQWHFPAEVAPLPLYRRHDGRYLWTTPYLGQLRALAKLRHQKDMNHEPFPV